MRDNVHLLVIQEDVEYLNLLVRILRRKGTKIVDFPTVYDMTSIIPFLLVNDHSIILIKNPMKEVQSLINLIIRKGLVMNKGG